MKVSMRADMQMRYMTQLTSTTSCTAITRSLGRYLTQSLTEVVFCRLASEECHPIGVRHSRR